MKSLLGQNPFILMEAAVVEQIRRSEDVQLHPTLDGAPLVYESRGKAFLEKLYRSYIDIAVKASIPVLTSAPTWKANQSRLSAFSEFTRINEDAIQFMKTIRSGYGDSGQQIKIGGLIGCKNDCYKPEDALSTEEAEAFHQWQADKLASAQPDFLMATTLPSTQEAMGMARAMAKTGLPYTIGLVINRQSQTLDGLKIEDAICEIDQTSSEKPLGYIVSCAHPSFLSPETIPKPSLRRIIGYQANASSLSHSELENSDTVQIDDISEWGEQMLRFHREHGVSILGGCCGTGVEHLKFLVENR